VDVFCDLSKKVIVNVAHSQQKNVRTQTAMWMDAVVRFVFSSDHVKISTFFGGGGKLMMDEVRVGKSRRNKNVIIGPSYASFLWLEYRKTKNMTKNHSLVRQKSTIRSCHF
jgi:hypothetical protein